jgi:hypothetical protein
MEDDEGRRPARRSPDWFLAKIAAGLEAAEIDVPSSPPRRRMSRAEIEALVNETLREELARLPAFEPAKPPETE